MTDTNSTERTIPTQEDVDIKPENLAEQASHLGKRLVETQTTMNDLSDSVIKLRDVVEELKNGSNLTKSENKNLEDAFEDMLNRLSLHNRNFRDLGDSFFNCIIQWDGVGIIDAMKNNHDDE